MEASSVQSFVARDWDSLFETWRKPPSETEQQKAEAVRAAITTAVTNNPRFSALHPRFVLHGSYGNNTNVRLQSDVDVAVVVTDYINCDFEAVPGMTNRDAGLIDTPYSLLQARHDVEAALRERLGTSRVQGKNKAIHVIESNSHIEADVIACFQHRRYVGRGQADYHEGICFQPLNGTRIIGWPEQNKANSTAKAQQTSRRYKKVVRILKRLRNEMLQQGHSTAAPIPGFLIESLAYNVPSSTYGHPTLRKDVREVIAVIYNQVKSGGADKWVELNERFYLFHAAQKWTKQNVLDWTHAAWNYAELSNA